MESEGVLLMYQDMYERWLAAELDDADLKPELESVKGDDAAIQDRFAVALKFGTAGLRGVIGAGTNRMNIYVVRQATQGLANWVKTQGGSQTVAISYDSRIKSNLFAKTAAEVLAANGIKVRIYSALMPVPALSFATRYYNCNAGIMVTASHNPAKYNGYKAYGPDGCQMTDEAADIVGSERPVDDWKGFEARGLDKMPVCMAKTQFSFSDDASKLGAPRGFKITVRDLKVNAGAGFLVAKTGDTSLHIRLEDAKAVTQRSAMRYDKSIKCIIMFPYNLYQHAPVFRHYIGAVQIKGLHGCNLTNLLHLRDIRYQFFRRDLRSQTIFCFFRCNRTTGCYH